MNGNISCIHQDWTVNFRDTVLESTSEMPDLKEYKHVHGCEEIIVYQKILTRLFVLKKHGKENED